MRLESLLAVLNQGQEEQSEGKFCRTLGDLYKGELMQLFVVLGTINVRLDCEGVSPHEMLVSFVSTGYILECYANC